MTLATIILLNAILGTAVVYGLLWLLVHGIHADRKARVAHVRPLRQRRYERLAA